MDVPADWLSETNLIATTGISRETAHRNLLNWRHNGLLPSPMIRRLGVGVGNEAVYPPIAVEMVRRIDQLRWQGGDMDDWLWSLWLEGYPVDVVGWCRRRLATLAKIFDKVEKRQASVEATRKPSKRSDPRRLVYRRLKGQDWYALMGWAAAVAIGSRPSPSLSDPASPVPEALAKAGNLSVVAGNLSVRDLLPQGEHSVEHMSIARVLNFLNGIAPAEIEQARKDWAEMRQAAYAGNPLALALWEKPLGRAFMLPGLIAVRRSPDHQEVLAERLAAVAP